MDKQRYYVSVQARTILEGQGDAPYELEIEATPEEKEQLAESMEKLEYFDEATFTQTATALSIAYHHDESNDGYDYYLKQVYQRIYELGTPATRKHIRSMKLLD